MIALIDTASNVRHACFNTLTEMGHSVAVFHSPDTFVNFGAIYRTKLLIIGKTRICPTKSEALLWARSARPNLRTVLPGLGEIELRQLCEAYEMEKVDVYRSDICDYLAKIRVALWTNNASMHSHYPLSTWGIAHGDVPVTRAMAYTFRYLYRPRGARYDRL